MDKKQVIVMESIPVIVCVLQKLREEMGSLALQ